MFIALYATLAAYANELRDRARSLASDDRGSITLEQAVIASALLLAALALAAAIVNAISSRTGMIH